MSYIKDIIPDVLKDYEKKTDKKNTKRKHKKTVTSSVIIEENKMEILPLSEYIVLKATGKITKPVAWYVDDMDLYMELFKYKNLDEACKEIYETKIAKTKISFEDENRKEEALKWIKGILKSLEGGS